GNDEEIISEVRKHANARVFAMGFGSAPNRHLLDKMSEYGRGEVEYLTENEDGSAAARRVFERIRSPLLTDISIDWNGLKVSDVYPRRIPDLFSARPVILTGRYSEGGRGTILLKGRMSGRDTVREIPVELPEIQAEHDVLATLWARRRIDDLLSQDQYTGYTNQMTDDVREAITRLGLQYRLMTQFTSFVAVEDRVVTDTGEPQRIDVPVETPASAAGSVPGAIQGAIQGAIPSGVTATVNVMGTASMVEVNSTSQELNNGLTATELRELPTLIRNPYMLAQLSVCATSDSEGSNRAAGFSLNGQRAASTNTMLDGVENVDSFGATVDQGLPVDSVQEFRAVTSNFSAEYGRSSSEQFITAERAGTNEYHGSLYGFFLNRQLNSLDTQQKAAGVVRGRNLAPAGSSLMPRYDFFRGGAELGGPVFIPTFSNGLRSGYSGKNRLFFYAAYERLQQGSAAAPGGIKSPTPEGLALLSAMPGLSATNLAVFNFYAPAAPVNNAGTINVNGVDVPIGYATFAAPSFLKQNNEVARVDFNQSDNTTHNWRLNVADNGGIDTAANLPAFFFDRRIKRRFFSYTTTHTFNAQLVNETRLAYRRIVVDTPAPNIPFPGLDAFPNIRLADLGINLGPNPFAPQTGVENDYRIGDQVSYAAGNHTLRLGGDFRKRISRQRFVRRERGDYEYSSADLFLRDLSPDLFGERSFGGTTYHGDQKILNAFFQDEWRIRPNVTLNLGLGYSYQEMAAGTRLQALNAAASAPGLIEFRAPQTDGNNFAPKLGLAYSPGFKRGPMARLFGSNEESVIRAGFTMGYDYVFDNIYAGANPPQTGQTVDVPSLIAQTQSFIADGAITNSLVPVAGDAAAAARLATSSYVPDQQVPYSLVWTLGFERRFKTDWAVELRYMGARGVHLLTQNRLNRTGKVGAQGRAGLPTFFAAPTQAELDGLRTQLTLADIFARSNYEPRFDAAGFNGANVLAFLSNGTSTYHGGSVRLLRRFTGGSFVHADYIWSHLIDDVPAGVNTQVLGPGRAEEFQDARRERADSALDRRHRFSLSAVYELPFFRYSTNRWAGLLLGGFNFSGRWTLESGAKATVLSGLDSNLNADAEGDRTIRNPFGLRNTASIVTPLLATCAAVNADGTCAESEAARTVGYLAVDPRAEYIQAGAGVISNSARNTLGLPGVNNLNFSIFKNFWLGEVRRIQLRADFFNLFNHPQYVEGSLQGVTPISYTTFRNINRVGALEFNRPDLAFSSNPRVVQLSLRFNF
ncbi:MAG TPA: hypothetical protein VE842_09990, partial [Pyrinomonadaceae bacterium]|nr:hypothetical protein [Pyrinomonadaceae bacterium]